MAQPELIEQLMRQPGLTPEAFQLAKQVWSQSRRMEELGLDTSSIVPREGFFKKALNVIDTPRQAIAGLLDTAFVRKDLGTTGVWGAIDRGTTEHTSTSDILRRAGVQNPIVRGLAGFAGDVLTDPLTYLGGVGFARRAGGMALSKVGEGVVREAERGLVAGGITDALKVTEATDRVVKDMGLFSRELKAFKTAQAAGKEDLKLLASQRLEALKPTIQPYLEKASQGLGYVVKPEEIPSFFAKPSITVSANIPFLGHIFPEKKEYELIETGLNPIGSVLAKRGIAKRILSGLGATIGAVLKPKRIGKDIEIPEGVLNLMRTSVDSAGEHMAKIIQTAANVSAKAVESTTGIPLVGTAVATGVLAAKEGAHLAKQSGELLQSIFARTFYEGRGNRDLAKEYLNSKAAARGLAQEDANATLGKYLFTPEGGRNIEGEALVKSATLRIDNATKDWYQEALKNSPRLQTLDRDVAQQMRTVSASREIPDTYIQDGLIGTAVDQPFRANINALLASKDVPQEEKPIIQAWLQFHDSLQAREQAHGVKVGLLDSYVMHRYLNGAKDIHAVSGGTGSITKHRKFESLADALQEGLVPVTDPYTLLTTRAEIGYRAVAAQKYNNRFLFENGTPLPLFKRILDEAVANPQGPEWQMLAKEGYRLPRGLTPLQAQNVQDVLSSARTNRPILAEAAAGRVKGGEDVAQSLLSGKPIAAKGGGDILTDPDVVNQLHQSAQDFTETLSRQTMREGFRPVDFNMPKALFGETGAQVVTHNGQEIVLPNRMAEVLTENVRGRDVVKQVFGDSDIGRKLLRLHDSGVSFIKQMTLLPFPAYWMQNLFGAQFMAAAEHGWAALNPGNMARTIRVLDGSAALRNTATGAILDSTSLKRFMRENAMHFSGQDVNNIIDAAGQLNLDTARASGRGVVKNLLEKDTRRAGLQQAQNKMNDMFEGVYRVNFMLDRFEKGDTLADGMRAANEALINYRDLSPIEQSVMRRFYMFYGWTSKSTKKALIQSITNPGALQMQIKASHAFAEFYSDPNALPTADEHESQLLDSMTSAEQMSFKLGKTADDKTLTARGFGLPMNTVMQNFTLNIPRSLKIDELISWGGETARRNIQKQFAAANPMINMAAQALSGKNLYFDKPLNAEFLRRLPSFEAAAERLGVAKYTDIPKDIDSSIKTWLKAVPDGEGRLVADPGRFWLLVNLIPGLSRAVSTVAPLANANVPVSTSLLPMFTGVRIEEQDPERALLGSMAAKLQELGISGSIKRRREMALSGQ